MILLFLPFDCSGDFYVLNLLFLYNLFTFFILFKIKLASSFQADVSLGNDAAVPLSGRGGINTYIPLISK